MSDPWQTPGSSDDAGEDARDRAPGQPAAPQYGQPQAPHYGQPGAPQYGQPSYPQYGEQRYGDPYGQPPYGNPYGQGGYGGYGYAGGQPGWTPPPKPGLIPLRPLGFGTLIGAPFAVLRRNPKPTFGSALLVQLAVLVVTGIAVGAVTAFALARANMAEAPDRGTVEAGSIAMIVVAAVLTAVISIIGSALLQGVIVTEVASGTLGEKQRLRGLWRGIVGRRLALIGWVLLLAAGWLVAALIVAAVVVPLVVAGAVGPGILLGVLVGLGLLVIGIWLSVMLSLVPSIIVLERASVPHAVARSWSLVRGSFWRTFGVQALIYVILQVASQIVTTPISMVAGIVVGLLAPTSIGGAGDQSGLAAVFVIYGIIAVVSLVVGSLVQVVQSATTALIYLDQRMRREGLDLQLLRFVEGRQAGARVPENPFQPPARGYSGTFA